MLKTVEAKHFVFSGPLSDRILRQNSSMAWMLLALGIRTGQLRDNAIHVGSPPAGMSP